MQQEKGATRAGVEHASVARQLLWVAARCWPLLLGNILEWYEFAIYGYLAHFLQPNFFHDSALATWLGYAVVYLARPLGGIVLGRVADKFGRRLALNISIIGMVFATVGQGLLPSYQNGNAWGGFGVVALVVLRVLQGLSAGGEVTTIDAYVLEVAPKQVLGMAVSLIAVNGNLATFLANGVVALCETALGDALMEAWGWRLPFLLALPPGLIAAWGRRRFPESELFEQERATASVAAEDTEKRCSDCSGGLSIYPVLLCIGGTLMNATCRNVGATWTTAYLQSKGLPASTALWAGTLANGVSLVLPPLAGWLTDVKGVAWFMLFSAAIYTIMAPCLFLVLALYPEDVVVAFFCQGLGFGSLLALVSATFHLYCAELFPTGVRAFALGLAYNVGQTSFGGLGPVIAQASEQLIGPAGPCLYLALSGCLTMASVLWGLRLQRLGVVELTHVRHDPYFGKAASFESAATNTPASEIELSAQV